MIAPTVTEEYATAVAALAAARNAEITAGNTALTLMVKTLGEGMDELSVKVEALKAALKGCHEEIIAAINDLRLTVDLLERQVADDRWPLPKYREMLFIY